MLRSVLFFIFIQYSSLLHAVEIRGEVNLEQRFFNETGTQKQGKYQIGLSIEPEFYWQWGQGDNSLTIKPYLRLDQLDSNRNTFDIRELMFVHLHEDYEFRVGVGKVFWGVTESQHLVDVINQTDIQGNIKGEDKLGQPMLQISQIKSWGVLEGFILPYFRKRKFPGEDGRLRPENTISEAEIYEFGTNENHIDFALRYQYSFDNWDIGASYFNGINREPEFIKKEEELLPKYFTMEQWGLDIQVIDDAWLWKLEMIHRNTSQESYIALTAGFEYSFYAILGTEADLGYLVEYSNDERGDKASSSYQNDVFIGMRLALNDTAGTDLLLGVAQDLDNKSSQVGRIEISSRINESWRFNLDASWFKTDNNNDPLFSIRKDDFLQLSFAYFF
jgi:hypothetical protein